MAMLYPESQQGKQITSLQKNEVAGSYIRKARIVLRVLPSVASEVISGGTSLNDAYQQARDIEAKSNSVESRLEALRQQFPDIQLLPARVGARPLPSAGKRLKKETLNLYSVVWIQVQLATTTCDEKRVDGGVSSFNILELEMVVLLVLSSLANSSINSFSGTSNICWNLLDWLCVNTI